MNCNDVRAQLDDYLDPRDADSRVDHDRLAASIALHVQGCPDCRSELMERQRLRDDLRALPVATPDADFLARAVAVAAARNGHHDARRRQQDHGNGGRRRWRAPATLTALAAALMLAFALGTLVQPPDPAPEPVYRTIHLIADTVTPVKLAFSSERALPDARLSLNLPVGVELVGYDGRSDLSWSTDLEAGTNVLRLPLVGRRLGTDFLIARLQHPSGSKTFRLQVTVNNSGAPDHE